MILYHGTITAFATKIQHEGLKPHAGTSFKLSQPYDSYSSTRDSANAVYVTADKAIAETFAKFKAEYMRAKYGDTLLWQGFLPMVKRDTKVLPDAKPCIVLISYDLAKLIPDDHSTPVMRDYMTRAAIPPSAIERIITL